MARHPTGGDVLASALAGWAPAATAILTPEGQRPIEQSREGDLVLSGDELDVA